MDKNELENLINFDDSTVGEEKQLFENLKLKRLGLYPQDAKNFAVFDYSIGPKLTDYLVVINLDKKGLLNYISMES